MTANYALLRRELEPLPHPERVLKLQAIGVPDHELPDLLAYLMRPKPTELRQKKQEEPTRLIDRPEIQEQMERIKALIAKNAPQVEQKQKVDAFQQDIQHVQYLYGQPSLYDEASYSNPNLIQTGSIKFMQEFHNAYSCFALIAGDKGSGKTFAGICEVNASAKIHRDFLGKIQYSNARIVRAYELATMLADKKRSDEVREIKQCGVLLLDDLGTEPVGYKGGDFLAEFEELIDYRHKFRKTTVMTTNLKTEDFGKTYGDRIVSRISQVGLVYEAAEGDMRRMA